MQPKVLTELSLRLPADYSFVVTKFLERMPISSRSEHGAYNLHGYPGILGLQTGRVGLSPIIQEFLMSRLDA